MREIRNDETNWKSNVKHVHVVRTKGDPEDVRAWVRDIWKQYDLDGIWEFRRDDDGPDSLYVFVDIPDKERALELMREHGFGIGLLNDPNLEIADHRGVREQQAMELALELGVNVALSRGHLNLLETGTIFLPGPEESGDSTARLVERFRARGIDARALTEEEWPEVMTQVAFFGIPRRIAELGDKVELHVEDGSEHGSWCAGFRAVSKWYVEDEERMVRVSTEGEYLAALKEGRDPDSQPWPVRQMRAIE